jgi:beta-galactosidase/beta-glucuronidase
MKNLEKNSGRLIWVDADVITEDFITIAWLDSLLSEEFSCHIGVPQKQYYSVETGFFIINLENKFKDIFLNEYKRIYYTKDFTDLRKPYDGDIFGKVIRKLKKEEGFKFVEMNEYYETALSPFNGIFEGKMKHYKAKRKNIFKDET